MNTSLYKVLQFIMHGAIPPSPVKYSGVSDVNNLIMLNKFIYLFIYLFSNLASQSVLTKPHHI
jgi:hypothetical protein